MTKFPSFEAYQKAEKATLIRRAKYALKKRSFKLLGKVCNDIAKRQFARFLVVDCYGTFQLCWSLKGAYAWLPFCSDFARIVDTSDFSVICERSQAYA